MGSRVSSKRLEGKPHVYILCWRAAAAALRADPWGTALSVCELALGALLGDVLRMSSVSGYQCWLGFCGLPGAVCEAAVRG